MKFTTELVIKNVFEDAAKRAQLANAARKKLANLHMFVSPLRIVVHNLPHSLSDVELRKICKQVSFAPVNEGYGFDSHSVQVFCKHGNFFCSHVIFQAFRSLLLLRHPVFQLSSI